MRADTCNLKLVCLIRCPVDGRPTPKVTWKEPKKKAASQESRLIYGKGQITITDIQTRDSGKYICTASNKLATTSSFMRLLVAGGCFLCLGFFFKIFEMFITNWICFDA